MYIIPSIQVGCWIHNLTADWMHISLSTARTGRQWHTGAHMSDQEAIKCSRM